MYVHFSFRIYEKIFESKHQKAYQDGIGQLLLYNSERDRPRAGMERTPEIHGPEKRKESCDRGLGEIAVFGGKGDHGRAALIIL